MKENPYIPFEKDITAMTPKKLYGFVCNWLWEGPIEYTPSISQTKRLIEIIQSRSDAAFCLEAVRICNEYLQPTKGSTPSFSPRPKGLDFDT